MRRRGMASGTETVFDDTYGDALCVWYDDSTPLGTPPAKTINFWSFVKPKPFDMELLYHDGKWHRLTITDADNYLNMRLFAKDAESPIEGGQVYALRYCGEVPDGASGTFLWGPRYLPGGEYRKHIKRVRIPKWCTTALAYNVNYTFEQNVVYDMCGRTGPEAYSCLSISITEATLAGFTSACANCTFLCAEGGLSAQGIVDAYNTENG